MRMSPPFVSLIAALPHVQAEQALPQGWRSSWADRQTMQPLPKTLNAYNELMELAYPEGLIIYPAAPVAVLRVIIS